MFLLHTGACLLALWTTVSALGGSRTLCFNTSSGGLPLSGWNIRGAQILVDNNDYWGVLKAASDLSVDWGKVTGRNLSLVALNANDTRAPTYAYRPTTNFVNYTVGPWQTIVGPVPYAKRDGGTPVIIAGTIGKHQVIDELVAKKALDISAVVGRWESYVSTVVTRPMAGVDAALVIAGSDMRGTIFGVSVATFRRAFPLSY